MNKWYRTTPVIIAALIIFSPVGLYLMWKYSSWDKETKSKITVAVIIGIFFLGLARNNNSTEKPIIESRSSVTNSNNIKSIPPSPEPIITQKKYRIVEKAVSKSVDNYKVLISSGEDGRAIASEVKKECNKPCNIDIFDNEKALNLLTEYDKMMGSLDTKVSDLDDWKKKNYIYVADHFIGQVTFDSELYQEFPFKDWYYKELKSL